MDFLIALSFALLYSAMDPAMAIFTIAVPTATATETFAVLTPPAIAIDDATTFSLLSV
jgi:hypothetical protein